MQIYPAELVDINICYQLNKSFTTDYVWQMQARENGHTPAPAARESDYEHGLAGFLDAQSRPWQGLLWISNLVIEHRYRRQGLGTRLLKAAIQWALERDIHQVTLEVQTKNYPAISFAQKHGFQFCGYNERYYPNGDIALFFSRYL